MHDVTGEIQVVNTLTGEITQFDYKNLNQLKDFYIEIQSMIKALKRAETKMKNDLEYAMGNHEELNFADGKSLKWQYRETLTFDKAVVAKYLDEDMMDVVTKIDNTALKELIKELNQDAESALPDGAYKEMELAAHRKVAKYIQVVNTK